MLLIKKIRTTEMTEYAKGFFTKDVRLSQVTISDIFRVDGLIEVYFRHLGFDTNRKIIKLIGKPGVWALICGRAA